MNLIDKFVLLTNQLQNSLSEVEWKEDLEKVQVVYQGVLGGCYDILIDPIFDGEINAEDTSFLVEVTIRNKLLFVSDLIEHKKYRHVDDNDPIKIELIFHKKLRLDIPTNAVLFFRESSFYNCFRFNNIAWNRFFQNVDDRYYTKCFLPISSEYSNDYLKILPLQNYSSVNEQMINQSYTEICRIKNIHNENTRTNNLYWPIPSVFSSLSIPDGELKNYLNLCFYVSVLVYIANEFEGDKLISFPSEEKKTYP